MCGLVVCLMVGCEGVELGSGVRRVRVLAGRGWCRVMETCTWW